MRRPVWHWILSVTFTVADASNYRVRRVINGIITTVAGNGSFESTPGTGDGGPATSASLWYVAGLAVDSANNLYLADRDAVRMVSNGIITTVAGGQCCNFHLTGSARPTSSQETTVRQRKHPALGPGGYCV